MTYQLDPTRRREDLAQLGGDDLDVLVVGGGIVGAGVALDAVSRGLRVALVERGDWGSGASSHTSMMVNGSWRDVADPDPVELRVALRERGMLLGWLAPHLVRRVPFLYPLHGGPRQRVAVGAEVLLYDAIAQSMTAGLTLPSHRHLARRDVRRLVPALRGEAVTGGVQFYDAQADDARLAITVVRTASAYGAAVVNRLEVVELRQESDRVRGARVRDRMTGRELDVAARVVVLATGHEAAFALGTGAHRRTPPPVRQRVHLVVARSAIRSSTGLAFPGEGLGLIRVAPWGRHWLIGPVETEEPVTAPSPTVARHDVERLLGAVNGYLQHELTVDQVQACYAGMVHDPSRSRRPSRPVPGVVVAGRARLSTYRRVAAQAMDEAVLVLGGLVAPSITERLPLLGADGYHARWNQRHLLARRAGLPVARVEHLLNRYGSVADELLQLVAERPGLAAAVAGAEDYLAVEIHYAASHEGATELGDVLARRTRIAIDTDDGGHAAAPGAAALLAVVLGWDEAEQARQVEVYRRWLAAERQALGSDV